MRIGYVSNSEDLQHPADRRRLLTWATDNSVELETSEPLTSDLLVLTNAANFKYWIKRAEQPVILDLVDGYLGENPRFLKDLIRNLVRTFGGTSSLSWITYTRHLKWACKMSAAVVVASEEQKQLVLPFNKNVHIILDDHSEVDSAILNSRKKNPDIHSDPEYPAIFWEGFGYTIKHFGFMAKQLDEFLNEFKGEMNLVTVEEFPRWGGYIGKIKTRNLIKKMFPLSWQSIKIIPWSLQNLADTARASTLGIIPIQPDDHFATMKSENKLLSMWHLGLPVIFSRIPAYLRTAKNAHSEVAAISQDSWAISLRNISVDHIALQLLQDKSSEYIKATHTREILVRQWDSVIRGLIKRS